MSKFNKIDTIGIIRSTGIVPVFYNKDAELTKKVVKACYDGGIRAFEFTNRGDGAHKVFEEVMVEEIVPLANRRGVPYSPGCGSVSEMVRGMELGCDLVKVFPAGNVGGPSFVKNVLGPLPWAMVMATGAVEPTEENLSAWAKSGVTAVGMGSKLFPKEVIAAGDWSAISALCAKCLTWFKK